MFFGNTARTFSRQRLSLIHIFGKIRFGVYPAMIAAMLCGRAVYALVFRILLSISGQLRALTAWGAFVTGLPGITVQLLLIPPASVFGADNYAAFYYHAGCGVLRYEIECGEKRVLSSAVADGKTAKSDCCGRHEKKLNGDSGKSGDKCTCLLYTSNMA